MTPFLLYIGRSSLYLAVFYAFFLLVMRRTSLFRFNRIMLLAGTVGCFVLPFIRLRAATGGAAAAGPLEAATAATAGPLAAEAAGGGPAPLLLLYVAGAAAAFVLAARSALRLCRTIRSGQSTSGNGYRLTVTEADSPSFSWGRHIVIGRKDLEQNPAILTHERMHVRARHSLDILMMTPVTVLHWFNPLVWITLSELKLLHEYEADEAVINQGIDATQYQLLLVKKAVGEHRFSLANGFQHSNLKNRINMMLKKPTPGWMRLSYVVLLPILAGAMFACNPAREQAEPEQVPALEQTDAKTVSSSNPPQSLSSVLGILENLNADKADLDVLRDLLRQYENEKAKANADKEVLHDIGLRFLKKSNEIAKGLKSDGFDLNAAIEKGESIPFQLVETRPTFNGGDANEFSQWVNSQLKYPEEAKKAGVQGRVTLQFTVDPSGKVGNVKVLRGVDELLDAEAIRVLQSSPDWTPGEIDGTPVSVTYTFPVVFKLK